MEGKEDWPRNQHVANHAFTKGLPTVRPDLNEKWDVPVMPGDPDMESSRSSLLANFDEQTAILHGFGNVAFLKKVTNGRHFNKDLVDTETRGWLFEDRRQAQAVLPFLFLGPASAAKDGSFLKENSITMVLLVRDLSQEISKFLNTRTAYDLGIEAQVLDVKPNKLVSALPHAINMINTHLSERSRSQENANETKMLNREPADRSLPGKVLVHDLTGNEAAAAVCCAYVMAMFGTGHSVAVHTVQGRRFSINSQLCHEAAAHYHAIIQAKRDISLATQTVSATVTIDAVKKPPAASDGSLLHLTSTSQLRGRKREAELDDTVDALGEITVEDRRDPRGYSCSDRTKSTSAEGPRDTSTQRRTAPFSS